MRRIALRATGAALVLYALALPGDVGACTVSKWPTEEELFERASTVFAAHVVRIEEGPGNPPLRSAPGRFLFVEFRLIEPLKGMPPAENRVVDLVRGAGDCGMPVLVGQDYVFYLHKATENLVGPFGASLIGDAQEPAGRSFLEKLRRLRKSDR
jgi:hypothetical protein